MSDIVCRCIGCGVERQPTQSIVCHDCRVRWKANRLEEALFKRTDHLTILVMREDDGSYYGRVDQMPGCMTNEPTIVELLTSLGKLIPEWISNAIDDEFGDLP